MLIIALLSALILEVCHFHHVFLSADDTFSWSGAGTSVFGSAGTQKEGEKSSHEAEEEGSDEETPHSDEIHFEPIVSLPEVSVCCGAVSCAARVSGEV